MTLSEKISVAYPGAQWSLFGDDYETLIWSDGNNVPKPTLEEIEVGAASFVAAQENRKVWTSREFIKRVPQTIWGKIHAAADQLPALKTGLLFLTGGEVWSDDPELNQMAQALVSGGVLTEEEGRLIIGEIDELTTLQEHED